METNYPTMKERRKLNADKRKKKMYGYWWLHRDSETIVKDMVKEFGVTPARIYQVIKDFILYGEPQ